VLVNPSALANSYLIFNVHQYLNCTTTTTNFLSTVTHILYFSNTKIKQLLLLLSTRRHALRNTNYSHHTQLVTQQDHYTTQNANYVLITANINILVFWDINWKKGTSISKECGASIFNIENVPFSSWFIFKC
jgi:hypothetical protein